MMEFKFDHHAPHQMAALNAVVKVFKGQPQAGSAFENTRGEVGSVEFGEKSIGNRLVLSAEQFLANVQEVQKDNELELSSALIPRATSKGNDASSGVDLNLSIEMETGTGKTYTYIRTMYELHRVYGFCKFVIVVPSVAIREGTLKNLEITAKDMKAQYGVPANYTVWDSKNRNGLRNFAASNSLQILVINIDSFASDSNIINTVREQGVKPIEFLQATRPIVIVDEPQNMETDIRRQAVHNLNPFCTLRYSATHKNPYNLISRLTPVDAYNLGLVKQIQVDGITADQNYNAAFVALKEIQRAKKTIKVKLSFFANGEAGGVLKKDAVLAAGDDLYVKSNQREIYRDGFIVEDIDAEEGFVKFTGGLVLREGDSQGGLTEELQKFQIERTVKWHFERAKKLHPMGIKVLSLFFIDKVANYRGTDGEKAKFEAWFEEAFEKFSKQNVGVIPHTAQEVHKGYFSQDKRGGLKDTKGTTKDDEDTYNLIMKNKEELLNLDNPVQFIFSHSALREGWDNPNVFQICTLNESTSDMKKRQEVGRGLRLPVNSKTGERITDKKINLLTVIANESYEAFTKALQTEIEEETGVPFTGRIGDANRDKVLVKYTKHELTRENYPLLFELWDKVSFHTRYAVHYDEAILVNKAVSFLKDANHYHTITRLQLKSNTAGIEINEFGVNAKSKGSAVKTAELTTSVMPDVFGFIQSRIKLSRGSIVAVLKECGRANELMLNPQRFLEHMVAAFERARNEILYEGGVKYERGTEWDLDYTQKLFTDELGEVLQEQVLDVREGYEDKTPFNYYRTDSSMEDVFARDCEESEEVKFFFKIPRGFKIPTPIGNYSPDWAVVLERDNKLYFVAETKGTLDPQKLRGDEKYKIRFGSEFFKTLDAGIGYKLAVKAENLIYQST
jgi:type III restriction enzyme